MFKIDIEFIVLSREQKKHILRILEKYIVADKQKHLFFEKLEQGLTYYFSQNRKGSTHNIYPEAYSDNDINNIKKSLDQLSEQLSNLEYSPSTVINQYYYLRERKQISLSGDWRQELQCHLIDISIACGDLLLDAKYFKSKRGYKLELIIVDYLDQAIDKSNIKLNIAIGGNDTPSQRLLDYLINEFDIRGNNNKPATARAIIDKWLKKTRQQEIKPIQQKNSKDTKVITHIKGWSLPPQLRK